jgi:hypothetical protein
MERHELDELHCIQPIENLPSISARGILSHRLAEAVQHVDVSDQTIQDLRVGKVVPDARYEEQLELHDYANAYICGHNPMLHRLSIGRGIHAQLAVLRLSCEILDLAEAVIADGNASSKYTSFHPSPQGLAEIDRAITFLGDPTHPNQYEFWSRKRKMCAEVLVPHVIDVTYIEGVIVSCEDARERYIELGLPWPVELDPKLFHLSS